MSEAVQFDPDELPPAICDQCGGFILKDGQGCYAVGEGVECSP